jgi:hypothetical protein
MQTIQNARRPVARVVLLFLALASMPRLARGQIGET